MTASLLIELGVEELPPLAMRPLAEALARGVAQRLAQAGVAHGAVTPLASPRRLAVHIADTAAASAAEKVEKPGPTVAIAFDEHGQSTAAGKGFAGSVGTTIEALDIEDSNKGRRLVYRGTVPGRPLQELLQPAVDASLRALPIPKRMRWGESEAAFVRPVHWVVALYGSQILPLEVFGVAAGRTTQGHRFHHPEPIELANADNYVGRLRDPGRVIVDMAARRAVVLEQVHEAATTLAGRALVSEALVDEVVALVEWPVGIAGRFDERYLTLPREVLVATLEGHQRYFPVEHAQGGLIAGFVTVANIASRDPAQVVAGNERVVRPRLSDALFFWNQDRRHGLAARLPDLARVSFQESLGSLADKCARIARIAERLATPTGAPTDATIRAARLAKADLLTEMVGEFPELQGIMGRYYAADEGEPEPVATALAEQYAPAGAGAPIAGSAVGRCLALADRLDTLAGIFAIDRRPSGDKDPFALRRAALGVLRTLIEGGISLDLPALIDFALSLQPVTAPEGTAEALWVFHVERLRAYYQERGVPLAHFEAVAALRLGDVRDADRRIDAIAQFVELDAAPVVCAAHKRIRNILKRNRDAAAPTSVAPQLLREPAELALHEAFDSQRQLVNAAMANADYAQALTALAPLAEPLDRFFADVMVMSDDEALRGNRLALLAAIGALCEQIADLSCLSVDNG